MAQRDRSQGFGFVYVDIASLLAQAKTWSVDDSQDSKQPEGKVVNFNKDAKPSIDTNPIQKSRAFQDRSKAVQEIQSNLDRLQALHHKLHAMLEELNQVATPNKKKDE